MGMCHRLVLLVTLVAVPGCFWVTTKSEGKALRRDVTSLESRVSTKEQVAELEKTLDQAAKLLKRNSADIGADVQRIGDEQRKLLGLLTTAQQQAEELKTQIERNKQAADERLAALEARIAAIEPKPTERGASPEELWTAGKKAFEGNKFADARESFKKLALGFPQHDRADDAQYFRAETHFSEKDWDSAIREYQKVFDKYPDSDLADDAMFRAAEAATNLKNCTEARTYFGLLKQKYPKSSLAKRAAQKDKELKSAAKNKKKCTS